MLSFGIPSPRQVQNGSGWKELKEEITGRHGSTLCAALFALQTSAPPGHRGISQCCDVRRWLEMGVVKFLFPALPW